MNYPNLQGKEPFLLDFSEAIEYFFDIPVESIHNYNSWPGKTAGFPNTHYHIDFYTQGRDPGYAKVIRISENKPIYEIALLCDDRVIEMLAYEFEIIRPTFFNTMTDIVNRYRTLLKIYQHLRKVNSIVLSHPFYIPFLVTRLRLMQNAIEEAAVIFNDNSKRNKDGTVEGLIPVDIEDRFPVIRDVKNVNEKLVENILLN